MTRARIQEVASNMLPVLKPKRARVLMDFLVLSLLFNYDVKEPNKNNECRDGYWNQFIDNIKMVVICQFANSRGKFRSWQMFARGCSRKVYLTAITAFNRYDVINTIEVTPISISCLIVGTIAAPLYKYFGYLGLFLNYRS